MRGNKKGEVRGRGGGYHVLLLGWMHTRVEEEEEEKQTSPSY